MHIYLRLAEPFWRVAGQRNLEFELAEQASLSDLLELLYQRYPDLEQEMAEASPYIFVGEIEAEPETLLTEGDRVHILWPIAGG